MDMWQEFSINLAFSVAVEPEDVAVMGQTNGSHLLHGTLHPGVDIDADAPNGYVGVYTFLAWGRGEAKVEVNEKKNAEGKKRRLGY